MEKQLVEEWTGFHFHVAELASDGVGDSTRARVRKCLETLKKDVFQVPGWIQYVDDNGFPTPKNEGMAIAPFEFAESDEEVVDVDGRLAFAIWIFGSSTLPAEMARAIRDMALDKLRKAEGLNEVSYAATRVTRHWRMTEQVFVDLD